MVLWVQRRPIASGFIDDELARRGVPARYRVTEIGLSEQRLENVVIGDPARPDLVADWIVVRTEVGLGSATVTAIEAGAVRLRGRVVDGRLALGAIDRLLPAPSGAPFALPDIALRVADARMRLETPQGIIGLKASGAGNPAKNFDGRIAAISERIEAGGCVVDRLATAMAVEIDEGAPALRGPLRAAAIDCPGMARARAIGSDLVLTLGPALDRWEGRAALSVARAGASGVGVTGLGGMIDFGGDAAATMGRFDLTARGMATGLARATGLAASGRYRFGSSGARVATRMEADALALAPASFAAAATLPDATAGTPVAPLARRLANAVIAAGRRGRASAVAELEMRGAQGVARVRSLDYAAASGARVSLAGGEGLRFGWPGNRLWIDTAIETGGGGLPEARVALAQARPDAAITGRATIAPYRASDAMLALAPVTFSAAGDGTTSIRTRAVLSGPLPGGRVDRLSVPIDARWNAAGRLLVNRDCAPAAFERLTLSALSLGSTRLRACPLGGAMLAYGDGGIEGGIALPALRTQGSLGGSPLALGAANLAFALRDRRVSASDVRARLGTPERLSRLDIARLDGRVDASGIAGDFAGAAGAIGNVPLLLSGGAGAWRFADATLTLDGSALAVADAAEQPRFAPLAADDFTLTLAGNAVDARATLRAPATQTEVADVTITHDLGAGAGRADLVVDGITFTEAFQPDALTRLTFGVIAEVEGTIAGRGQIRWSPDDVTSDGVFRTDDIDLAAAFGPVEGIAGEIRFTDLLGLETAPGQSAAIALANPGIPVENGTVRYRLTGEQRVAIEGGRWPFAGGALVLEPTLLDFGQTVPRRMTFRVEGVDAAQFLQQFDFDNLSATGTFDGVLPMVFDEAGGRIENGRLAMREGGGTIAYVGEVSQENLGTWGNIAFQALKSLEYDRLDMTMNGPLSGEMVTAIRFAGVSQGVGAKRNFIIDRLARLPFVFNVTIKAPFRQLFDSVQSYYDPTRLIERNLPALLEQQQRDRPPRPPAPPVQPPASEPKP
ncbi:hypothetical protein FBR43_07985 [Sphingomonas baiyangensis]|uniref:Dicarboxylate transport domain-containing protein n=2 Tax=Sphingomonas baiyangensis TaxID=2572576 RepID=A0A4U1L6D1_9SPHN|nr:hypothetical protein FBR43_07985 [Sphingomonas baiyangensis]